MSLSAHLIYPIDASGLPLVVLMHGFTGTAAEIDTTTRERYAGYGAVVLLVEMRGRGTSGGDEDAGGREIQDIIDAIEAAKTRCGAKIDADRIHAVGYSGGGGNVFSLIARFPDYFNTAVTFFGISDYGHDATDGWYNTNAEREAGLEAWIGGDPATVPAEYHARASVLAVTNFTGGHLWMFHDEGDTVVPVVNSDNVRDAFDAVPLTNYDYGRSTAASGTRWAHGYPENVPALIDAEDEFIPAILADTYPAWTVPASGTLKVAGWLDTKRFRLDLGTLDDEFGTVVYNMTTRVFTITSDTGAADWSLTLKGQTPSASISATVNGVEDTQASDADGNVTFTGSIA